MSKLFELPETKGTFRLRGKVSGCKKKNFYENSRTKSGKPKHILKVDICPDEETKITCSINGYTKDNVYFTKYDKDAKKNDVKKVPWENRKTFKQDGYNVIGVSLGLEKTQDDKGNLINKRMRMVEFDAAEYASQHLEDGQSLYIQGNITHGSFTDQNSGNKRAYSRLEPTQMSLCSTDIDFKADDFEAEHTFKQSFVYTGIEAEKDQNDVKTGRYLLYGKVVGYNSIEDVEFVLEEDKKKIANTIRRKLKPYNAVEVGGMIKRCAQTETVQVEDDGWGDWNEVEKPKTEVKTEFIVVAVNPTSIDEETYSKESIEEALLKIQNEMAAKEDFGESTNSSGVSDEEWGKMVNEADDDENADW